MAKLFLHYLGFQNEVMKLDFVLLNRQLSGLSPLNFVFQLVTSFRRIRTVLQSPPAAALPDWLERFAII
jgi:hypothetical protein